MIKIAATALITCTLALFLKKDQPTLCFLVCLCGVGSIGLQVLQQLKSLAEWLALLGSYAPKEYASCMLRIIGIAMAAQFTADSCKDAGYSAAASSVETGGRILAALQAFPMLRALLQSFLLYLQ